MNRERVVRMLTFWLRPEFLLRVVNRFQRVAGFDRSIALASAALTATIPLTIVTSALASDSGEGHGRSLHRPVQADGRRRRGGPGHLLAACRHDTTIGIVGFLFLMVAVLSFSRAVQRLFEQAWELSR